MPSAEIHFLVKENFKPVVENNPYLSKIYSIKEQVKEVLPLLQAESYDYVIDLHHNLRSAQVKQALSCKNYSFNKLNIQKWLLVYFKINKLPKQHIVDRYFETVQTLGVQNDKEGLDFFISETNYINTQEVFGFQQYHALVTGGSYFTKKIPLQKLEEICILSDKPLILLGGKEDEPVGLLLEEKYPQKVFSACGKYTLQQSASIIQQAEKVITGDTGLMHIASAFKKDIFSLWGNTVPEFGMYPYLPGEKSRLLEVKNLSCRPCSKLGYHQCPKKHFKCMNELEVKKIFNS